MFPTHKLSAPVIATAIAFAVSSCASSPPQNPRLSSLELDLKNAYGDKYVAEYGQADLASAEDSLAAARISIRKGRRDETDHDLTMAENYIALGEIHGRQERTKAETVALKDRQDQIRLASRDRDVSRANERAESSRADAVMANMATQDAQAAKDAADKKLASMRDQLRVYDMKITEMGATLVLRDVMFDSGSSILKAGAVNRLDPLISYLRSSPATMVRIEGHTDSTGSFEKNNELSLNRANSVKQALLSNTSVTNSIDTYGFGPSKPIASNGTVSGREQNRRVEVTLR